MAALQGAREGIVLLKNQGSLLPLDPAKVKTIAVIGPDAFPAIPTAGGSGQVPTFSDVSALKGLSDRLGLNGNVLYDRGVPNLSVLAMRSGFMLAPDKFVPGLTVETFDNDKFEGKPVATRTEMTANTGQNDRTTPDLAELINSITAEQMAMFMGGGGPPRFERWTGYYFARASRQLPDLCGRSGTIPVQGRRQDRDRPRGSSQVRYGSDRPAIHTRAAQSRNRDARLGAIHRDGARRLALPSKARWSTSRPSTSQRRPTR